MLVKTLVNNQTLRVMSKDLIIQCNVVDGVVIEVINGNLAIEGAVIGENVKITARKTAGDIKGNVIITGDILPTTEIIADGEVTVKKLGMVVEGTNPDAQLPPEDILEQLIELSDGGYDNIVLFKKVIDKTGADYRAGNDRNSLTLIMRVAESGKLAYLKILISQKADVNDMLPNSETALYFALKNGHFECAKILIDAGALVKFEKIQARNIIYYAIEGNFKEQLENFLKTNEINLNISTEELDDIFSHLDDTAESDDENFSLSESPPLFDKDNDDDDENDKSWDYSNNQSEKYSLSNRLKNLEFSFRNAFKFK